MKPKPKVGEKLIYVRRNRARPATSWSPEEPEQVTFTDVTVTKVGTKYFEVNDRDRDRICIDDGRPDNRSGDRYFVRTMDEWNDFLKQEAEKRERYSTFDAIQKFFNGWGASQEIGLDQLRRIKAIIEEAKQ